MFSRPCSQESGSLLVDALRLAGAEGFCLGVKLVRGAYMDKERQLAEREGRPDPVHQSWEDTNHSYNDSLDLMLEAILQKPERCRMIVATHNEESVRRAATRSCTASWPLTPDPLADLRNLLASGATSGFFFKKAFADTPSSPSSSSLSEEEP
ncbi:putative proline dehydrogenase 2 [Liparis tanakae]|uniref:Proline dehydrogenase n=1 Tax=Liparis tanakae TaxID=230148 RepID=A0A4Z2F892_9TELE|nr:putative proline dehydrogenase 2 [Liparis tanakae]